ncbi:hypothetical protein CIC12_17500, partial [Burkholderia sp. SG-MS1]|nr:hypothetical protein [Paraburkholderia sp. SG-MS1]
MPSRSFYRGQFTAAHENAARTESLLLALKRADISATEPDDAGIAPIAAVHDAGYIAFLREAWQRWQADGAAGEVIPNVFPVAR